MTSVRRTLIATLLVATTLVTAAASAVVYRLTRTEIDAVFDYHLRQLALSLRDQVLGRRAGVAAPSRDFDFVIQIWDVDGTKLYASGADTGLPEVAQLGFATVRTTGATWRVFSADLGGQVIQVAQPSAVRQRLAFAAALRTLAPLVLMLPLLALLVWRIVGRSLAPLERLARAVGARNPAALSPIGEAGAPEEALPLVRALNDLLHRLATTLSAQRAFVADAAHELRTPLAALQLQLQLVERAGDERERAGALGDLRRGLDRAAHVVQQLLTLAREEPGVGRPPGEPVRLADLAAEVVADHAVVAEAKGVDLGAARRDEGAVVGGEPAALRTLLSNLVDNAVRWTPAGGKIDVTAALADGRPYLEVADTGPGIPASERVRVLDRFYRRAGGDGTGAGLGLAIVKAIADRHGAELQLGDTPGGGLTVRATFPHRDAGP